MTDKYKDYRVRWEIGINAENPKEAARKALEAQNPYTSAVFFDVTAPDGATTRINLAENTITKEPAYYLLVVWDDIEPEIKGPYLTQEERFKIACKIRKEEGKDHGLFVLDTINGSVSVDTFNDLPEIDF